MNNIFATRELVIAPVIRGVSLDTSFFGEVELNRGSNLDYVSFKVPGLFLVSVPRSTAMCVRVPELTQVHISEALGYQWTAPRDFSPAPSGAYLYCFPAADNSYTTQGVIDSIPALGEDFTSLPLGVEIAFSPETQTETGIMFKVPVPPVQPVGVVLEPSPLAVFKLGDVSYSLIGETSFSYENRLVSVYGAIPIPKKTAWTPLKGSWGLPFVTEEMHETATQTSLTVPATAPSEKTTYTIAESDPYLSYNLGTVVETFTQPVLETRFTTSLDTGSTDLPETQLETGMEIKAEAVTEVYFPILVTGHADSDHLCQIPIVSARPIARKRFPYISTATMTLKGYVTETMSGASVTGMTVPKSLFSWNILSPYVPLTLASLGVESRPSSKTLEIKSRFYTETRKSSGLSLNSLAST